MLERSFSVLQPFVRTYFRAEVRGMERVPEREQVLVVTHHDGGVLPVNGICFGVHWYERFGFDRPLYVLTHDIIHQFFDLLGTGLLPDSGLVRADRRVMDRVVSTGSSLLVFPGAARETFRPYSERTNIDLGGRSGFVAQSIRWGLTILPVVSAGAHETVFVIRRGRRIAEALGLPKWFRSADVFPILAGLPFGVWALPFLPQIPLPAKITTEVLPPIRPRDLFGREVHPSEADDPRLVREGYERVLERMRAAVTKLYAERRFPIIG